MVNVARSVSKLRRHVSLKTLMGISTIFESEYRVNTDFTVYKCQGGLSGHPRKNFVAVHW